MNIKTKERIESIVGSWRLEGLTVDKQVLKESQRLVRGEISYDDAVRHALNRVKIRNQAR